ncbi:MAG: HAMP domain-containing sensor histidine kinase [bacterium]
MTGPAVSAVPQSLAAVRRRLTIWYAATFLVILALLGLGMFVVITRRFDLELEQSLGAATAGLVNAPQVSDVARIGEYVGTSERMIVVLDTLGIPLSRVAPTWTRDLARSAWREQHLVSMTHLARPDEILRAVARPLRALDGGAFVAVAISDEVEVEDRYRLLIVQFSAAAGIAVLLVAVGGWAVARQAMVPAERAFAHMRRFMADAAHELRTPVSVVRARAGVALQRDRSANDYVDVLASIDREAERIGGIVDDLLTLARADAGERPVERRRVFLDDVMLDAVDAARAIATSKAQHIDVGDFEEAPVIGDAVLLRQLVLILLDNAIKYTPREGTITIGVRASGSRAVLVVSDSGGGITPQQLPHIFERFYRGDSARTRSDATETQSEGAGLGLAIAQWITEEHRGAVNIESLVNQGTIVTVSLPLARQQPVA